MVKWGHKLKEGDSMQHKFRSLLCLALCAIFTLSLTLPALAAENEQDCGAKLMAITFDDGPGDYTLDILDALEERGVKATFFITGSRVSAYPGVLDAIVAGGHQLANHTHNHKNLNTLTAQQASDEINATRDLLVEAGGDQTYYVRAPYGNANKTVKSVVNAPLIYWSVDPEDWKYRNADTVYANIVNNSYDGCIILCHDVYKTTVDGALRAIDELQSQGYEFVTVEQLLTRRGITPENGVVYYDAKNNGINLPAGVSGSEYYDESKLSEHWAYDALTFCLDRGYLERDADGNVLPNHKITRGDFIASLGRFCGISKSYRRQNGDVLNDVSSDDPDRPYIEWANDIGLMTGYNGSFRPDDTLTREEMATVVSRYLLMRGKQPKPGSVDTYKDAAHISGWAIDGVGLCTKLGILKGSKGYFLPKQSLTRAQTAAVLQRLSRY